MVNTENIKESSEPNKKSSAPISEAMARVVGELVHTLSTKLEVANELEVLHRLNFSASSDFIDTCCDIDRMLACKIATNFASFAGLHAIQNSLSEYEDSLKSLLSQHARRLLNIISEVPPRSTLCATLVTQLKASSVISGHLSDTLSNNWNDIWRKAQTNWENLGLENKLLTSNISKYCPAITDVKFASVVSILLTSLSDTVAITHGFATALLSSGMRVNTIQSETLSSMKCFEQRLMDGKKIEDIIYLDSLSKEIMQAKINFISNSPIAGLLKIEHCLEILNSTLEILKRIEPQITANESQKSLHAENYLYVQSFAKQLIYHNENPREIEKLIDILFAYSIRNSTSCIELLDEEIHSFNACINKENITKARLAVRLNDFDFPLSVAHKDYILQRIK